MNLSPPLPTKTSIVLDYENEISSLNNTILSINGKRSEKEGNVGKNQRTSYSHGRNDNEDDGAYSGDDDDNMSRKKLRLFKEQALVLEETFKEHNTLSLVSERYQHFCNFNYNVGTFLEGQ